MPLLWFTAVILSSTFLAEAGKEYTCPAYADLAESSVAPHKFNMSMLAGTEWLMLATSEPTIPAFCSCTVSTYSVHLGAGGHGGWYNYTANTSCSVAGSTARFQVPLKGLISADPQTPGLLHETLDVFNQTLGPRDPNYVFRVKYNSSGHITAFHTYACLGRVFNTNYFSYNYLVRKEAASASVALLDKSAVAVEVEAANSKGFMDTGGVRFTDASMWRECKVLQDGAVGIEEHALFTV